MDWDKKMTLAGFPQGVDEALQNWATTWYRDFDVDAITEEVHGIVAEEFDAWIARYDPPEDVLGVVDTLIDDERWSEICQRHERTETTLTGTEQRVIAQRLADKGGVYRMGTGDAHDEAHACGAVAPYEKISEANAEEILTLAAELEVSDDEIAELTPAAKAAAQEYLDADERGEPIENRSILLRGIIYSAHPHKSDRDVKIIHDLALPMTYRGTVE